MAQSTWVYDVDEGSFEQRVIARSRTVPVLVDFWAAWCAPCRMLGPLLEQVVDELGGRVEMAKLDTDRNQALAARYQIRGIPAVKLFVDGEVAAEFVGAQDKTFLRQFLAEHLPSPSRTALEGIRAARRAHVKPVAELEGQLRVLADDREVGTEARRELADLLLGDGRLDDAERVLEPLADAPEAEHLRQRIGMARDLAAAGGEEGARARIAQSPDDLDARWALAAALDARGDVEGALAELIDLVAKSRRYREDGARKAMLAIFDRLGPASDLAREYRRKLQILT